MKTAETTAAERQANTSRQTPFFQQKAGPDTASDAGPVPFFAPALRVTPLAGAGNPPVIQRDGEGTSRMEENVHNTAQDAGTHVWSGLVDRREYVPASGTTPRRELGGINNIRVEFDPGACEVRLPTRAKFEHPSATNWPFCGADTGTPPPAALPQGDFDTIKTRFLRETNSWLNGWFTARITGCENACADREIPIRAVMEEDASNPTTTVIIANSRGRSCAHASKIVIHALGLSGGGVESSRLVHEAGHTMLGYGDEYPVASGNPHAESVREGDFSAAGATRDFEDWMLLHRRHFEFVPAFLRQILPGCTVDLASNNRSGLSGLFSFGLGGTSFGGGGMHISAGIDLAIPFDIERRLQMTLGPHVHGILGMDATARHALMAGLRLGLVYNTNLSSGGLRLGAFGELGGGHFRSTDLTAPADSRSPVVGGYGSPYYGVGGSLSYTPGVGGGLIPHIGVEASYGSTFGLDRPDMERYGTTDWFSIGLNFGVQWR